MTAFSTPPVLVRPTLDALGGYEDALTRGWAPDPRRTGDAAYIAAELDALRADRAGYLDRLLTFPAPAESALPTTEVNHALWISDGEFAGKADLRFVPATGAVPYGVPGHVGYSIVPWKQGRGYATAALRALMAFAKTKGLTELQILCNVENLASRAVVEKVGGEVQQVGPHPSDRPEQMKVYYRVRV
ncbi:GNAT family N-acetyltransferase [Pleomorphomonas sp. JP5]|uniref:GNAT family N-acetyltransferase n=1 Tax=Pleomorphomonas sp. JP5 TaxID=2942998 RepID=UPI002043733D|nr:GNAT family N-acetyltransferase [Pleomorphomonas sp. JP5]MCM5557434.1 GNAT family N-acetyltransferase [Pleomorphomonas sp. JP5]